MSAQRTPEQYGPNNPPPLREKGESISDYRVRCGWDLPKVGQHTRGRWGTHFHPAHGHCITQVNEHGQPMPGDIAVVFMAGNGRTGEQCKAYARLIATAPEMLEMLEALEQSVFYLPEKSSMREKVSALIAKATGSAA